MTYVESARQGDNGFFGRWQEDQGKFLRKVAPGIVVDVYNEKSSQVLLRSSDALSLKAGQGERFYRRWRTGKPRDRRPGTCRPENERERPVEDPGEGPGSRPRP